MDPLTRGGPTSSLGGMASTALTACAPAALAVPAGVLQLLPGWAVLALIGVGVLLTVAQVAVTQYIRIRAIGRITRSQDAIRVLEIEDRRRAGAPWRTP